MAYVVFDACVLMSRFMTRLLLQLADDGLLRPVWSQPIGEEWRRNAARVWSCDPRALDATWQAMQRRYPDADAGAIRPFETGLRYSDPKDWHVIAAARAMQARHPGARLQIATWNLNDFNRSELRRLGIEARTPDNLLQQYCNTHPDLTRLALLRTERLTRRAQSSTPPLADLLQRERIGPWAVALLTPPTTAGAATTTAAPACRPHAARLSRTPH